MDKYRIVAIANLFFGAVLLIWSLIPPLVFFPGLNDLYSSIPNSVRPNFTYAYTILAAIFLIALINLFFGVKGLSKSAAGERPFWFRVFLAVATLLVGGVLVGVLNLLLLVPMYNLASP